MNASDDGNPLRVACDACCGGLARWLRLLGVDTTYTHGIDDGDLVRHAQAEGRVVVSSDHRLFLRRAFTREGLRGVLLPVGIPVADQLEIVVPRLGVTPGVPRCTHCNGKLREAPREEVAHLIPPRTLKWLDEYFQCTACGHLFWEGTHWRRIHDVRHACAKWVAG